MALVPLTYNLRSMLVRRSATLLTVLGIGATVAVISGVLALQQGFERLFAASGRADLAVIMRQGSTDEGSSILDREDANALVKSSPEIAEDEDGRPLASMESYLGVRRFKVDGGETNVAVRGIQPLSIRLAGAALKLVAGRHFTPGSDEVIVGAKLSGRVRDCQVGDVIVFNTTPFRVVGVFECDGPFASEIWGDVERIGAALERPVYNRIVALLKPGVALEDFAARVEKDEQAHAMVESEREYLTKQTRAMSAALLWLGGVLALIMGVAAIFTATNTMLAALAARTHEIGVLLALGFRPAAVFCAFLAEAVLLCLLGGAAGCLMTLPLNGIETGTTNYQTFTEVAFAFRVTPQVLVVAVTFSLLLGLAGGALPAWRAARMNPTAALRRL
ncbi:MAG: ABC transporter permease [Planctomycetes bacterium]|nr:ABC transporter permease [Planctomycetota bacterium]